MLTLHHIEALTATYSEARDGLGRLVDALQAEVADLKRRYHAGILAHAQQAAAAKAELEAAVEAAPELFAKPRTRVWHGVKVGWVKGRGGLEWDDPDQVVQLILKHRPDEADLLVKTTRTPVKRALEQLPGAELKKLGCRLVESGDQVVVKPMEGDIEKLVDALLKDAGEDVPREAA